MPSIKYSRLPDSLNHDESSEEDVFVKENGNAIPLQKVRSRSKLLPYSDIPKPQEHFITRIVTSSDSLRSFALKFGCTISDLKRVNNLITDLDLYALPEIKIPIVPFSCLLDAASDTENVVQKIANSVSSDEDCKVWLKNHSVNELVADSLKTDDDDGLNISSLCTSSQSRQILIQNIRSNSIQKEEESWCRQIFCVAICFCLFLPLIYVFWSRLKPS